MECAKRLDNKIQNIQSSTGVRRNRSKSTTGMYRERNGTDFHWKLWPGTVRNGTDDVSELNGREWNGTDFFSERNGTERIFVLDGAERNGTERIFVLDGAERNPTPKCQPNPKNGVVTKTFAPKFRSEPSDREVHSSYGDYFRDHFCVCVSGPLSGPTQGPTQGLHKGPSGSWQPCTRPHTSPLHKGSPNTL